MQSGAIEHLGDDEYTPPLLPAGKQATPVPLREQHMLRAARPNPHGRRTGGLLVRAVTLLDGNADRPHAPLWAGDAWLQLAVFQRRAADQYAAGDVLAHLRACGVVDVQLRAAIAGAHGVGQASPV